MTVEHKNQVPPPPHPPQPQLPQAVRGSGLSSPGGPGAGVVLKTRDWRPYQTTGFPEEGRVDLRDGAPPLGVPGLVEGAHTAHPVGKTASAWETPARDSALARTAKPQSSGFRNAQGCIS